MTTSLSRNTEEFIWSRAVGMQFPTVCSAASFILKPQPEVAFFFELV